MKRFIIAVSVLVALAGVLFYAVYYRGFYLDLRPEEPVEAAFRTEGKALLRQNEAGQWEEFVVKGVDVSSSLPGYSNMDYEPTGEDYLRWLEDIGRMGANTIRVYTILDEEFYQALYTYNTTHDIPLYLLQGLQVTDRANYGAQDVYDQDFLDLLLQNGQTAVDVIHGRKIITLGDVTGTGRYRWDLSPWVIGYLVGSEWDSGNIAYTNRSTTYPTSYEGEYFVTGPDATRFEVAIAQVMDRITAYESTKYKTQRLIGFVNDPSNDPFAYEDLYQARFQKYSQTDGENVLPTENLLSGYFAAYRLNYFSPDFLSYFTQEQRQELGSLLTGLDTDAIYNGYLDLLSRYHTMPVLATYGFSTSRNPIFEGEPPLTEEEQGEALVRVWQDATRAGWAGGFVSTWQDVWERRTWNTIYTTLAFDDQPWQDVQTDGQGYGLMEFYLGEEERVCYVDGDPSEWTQEDVILEGETGRLSMQYDEKYLYFLVEKESFDPQEDVLYLPVDVTPNSGSEYCSRYDLYFERPCDVLIRISGDGGSRVLVQERYESLWAMFAYELAQEDAYAQPPAVDSPQFVELEVMVQRATPVPVEQWSPAVTYETGALRQGNANPQAEDYDSLADYQFTSNGVELRLPWQLLNFANPVEGLIHDDYYEHYGVEYLQIEELYVGMASRDDLQGEEPVTIPMGTLPLEGWDRSAPRHERLKKSYDLLQAAWTGQ